MANDEQLDIRQVDATTFRIEFPYNEDFIAFLKSRIPWRDRGYDEDTHTWTVRGEQYIGPLESVGLQKFTHVMRIYPKDGGLAYRNVRTGRETLQKGLFA